MRAKENEEDEEKFNFLIEGIQWKYLRRFFFLFLCQRHFAG